MFYIITVYICKIMLFVHKSFTCFCLVDAEQNTIWTLLFSCCCCCCFFTFTVLIYFLLHSGWLRLIKQILKDVQDSGNSRKTNHKIYDLSLLKYFYKYHFCYIPHSEEFYYWYWLVLFSFMSSLVSHIAANLHGNCHHQYSFPSPTVILCVTTTINRRQE